MKDHIFVVDPQSQETLRVEPTTFQSLNIKERQDLQEWLIRRPDVLGEALFLITSEFDGFDKSDKRLDLLLLDRNATLVVAELKLDVARTLADQQAIRYAAMCSTMTMEDVVDLCRRFQGNTQDETVARICQFLECNDLPPLSGEPRVMLVAGSFLDQELMATVMWLRKFEVDISCIELTPYRYPGDNARILLVPKTLIPLSEARDYQIRVERKERKEISRAAENDFSRFFGQVLKEYASLNPTLRGPQNPSKGDWMSVHFGNGQIHYEWLVRKRNKHVEVALHFEGPSQDKNLERLNAVLAAVPALTISSAFQTSSGAWGAKNAQFSFRVPYQDSMPGAAEAHEAANQMVDLIEQTFPVVRTLS